MSVTFEGRTRTANASDEILGPTLAAGRGGDIAILFGDEAITFDQLDAEVNRCGIALRPHLGKGDRALLLLKDSPVFVAAFLGVMRIGTVAVPISTRLTAEDLAFVMADSGAKALIIDDDFFPQYRRAIEINGRRPDLVAVRGQAVAGARRLEDVLAGAHAERPKAATTSDDMAYWLYSSGTTGRPKAAIHVHGNLATGDRFFDAFGFGPGERVFSSSKLFFAYALGHVLIGGLRTGSTIVLFDGWPDGEAIARMVERYRPTIMVSVPTFYRSCCATIWPAGRASRPSAAICRRANPCRKASIPAGWRRPAFPSWKGSARPRRFFSWSEAPRPSTCRGRPASRFRIAKRGFSTWTTAPSPGRTVPASYG